MAFFEEREPAPESEETPVAAPTTWIPGTPGTNRLVVRTDSYAVVVGECTAWPTGFAFVVTLCHRWLSTEAPERGLALRVGLQFADGRRASAVGPSPREGTSIAIVASPGGQRGESGGPVLMRTAGGSGGGRDKAPRSYSKFEVWELPPDGPLLLVVDGPGLGIDETWIDLDGTEIRSAGLAVEPIWP